jgi:hypothetical protein
MTSISARYANWKAPAQDGEFLIWPDAAQLLKDTEENGRRLSAADQVRIQNVPLPEWRGALRKWLGHDDSPLIATGHQTELYHAGVWVKGALINAAAAKVGGQAYHFAVDTDQPKHLNIRWPGCSIPLTDDPAVTSAEWSGLLHPPTPAHLRDIQRQLVAAESRWDFKPVLDQVLDSLRRFTLEPTNLSTALTNAEHQLDWDLGLRHHAMIVSPILSSEPYLAFAHHLLCRADQFAADYNAALAEYRAEAGITSNMRPMPDLHIVADAVEAPFWFDDLVGGSRSRAQVHRSGSCWVLRAGGEEFRFDPAADGWTAARELGSWLRQHHLRISTRALTLTMFLRLLVVDQFVHGIGGGRYDQVTDRLIARHFKFDPPAFAVTTATLFFPGSVGRARACLSCIAQEGHRLKHRLLGERKGEILAEINALPRRSVQRSLAFHQMHGALSIAAKANPVLRQWEARYRDAERRDREDEAIFDRELFYAIQPRDRLVEMIGKYAREFV